MGKQVGDAHLPRHPGIGQLKTGVEIGPTRLDS
jgi:hypothetical protein